jgi:hypothetical protein
MHFHRGRVQTEGFDLDAQNLLLLQFGKHLIQDAFLRPTVHAHIDAVPVAVPLGQSAPLTSVLGHVESRIQQNQVQMTHIAPLHRQAILNSFILLGSNLHALHLSPKIVVVV